MNKTINIGIVTGTRAEYGLLSRTIELLQKDERFQTYIFVCGTHLSPEFGYTITELEKNGVKNIIPIEMLMSSSSRVGIAKSVGIATISFAASKDEELNSKLSGCSFDGRLKLIIYQPLQRLYLMNLKQLAHQLTYDL